MRTERRSRVSRERGEARETRGRGPARRGTARASRAQPRTAGKQSHHVGDNRMAPRHAGGARAGTHSSLSFAMALAERTRTRKARAWGLSPLRRTSRAVCGGLPVSTSRTRTTARKRVCFRPSARVFARGATTDRRRENRIDGTVFSRVFFLVVQQRSLHGARRVARRAEEECSSERRNVVPMLTCRAPP